MGPREDGKPGHLTWRTSEEQLSSLYGAKPAVWWLMFTISTPPLVEQMSTRTSLVSARSLRQACGVMAQENWQSKDNIIRPMQENVPSTLCLKVDIRTIEQATFCPVLHR